MTLHVYEELEQGTDDWHAARRGVLTASVVGKLLALESPSPLTVACPKCKAGEQAPCMSLAATKAPTPIKTLHPERIAVVADLPREVVVADNDTSLNIVATLAAERLSGITEDIGMTKDMWRGVDTEPYARDFYAAHNMPVEQVGFIVRSEAEWELGYSPDGLVGKDGLLEIKAPRQKTHLLTVLEGEVPDYNMGQLQCGLLVTGRKWADFVPYVGGLPMWTKRVHPDLAWQSAIVAAAVVTERRIEQMVADYRAATAGLPIAECIPDPDTLPTLRLA